MSALFDFFRKKSESFKNVEAGAEENLNEENQDAAAQGNFESDDTSVKIDPVIDERLFLEFQEAYRWYFYNQRLKIEKMTYDQLVKDNPGIQEKVLSLRTKWDRRSLFFEKMDEMFKDGQNTVQKAERLIHDRKPREALKVLEKGHEGCDVSEYFATCSKAMMVNFIFDGAIDFAMKSLEAKPENYRAMAYLVDTLHMMGAYDKTVPYANKITEAFEPHVEANGGLLEGDENKFRKIFMFENQNIMHSAILMGFFLNNCGMPDEYWSMAEEDYYWHPGFRMLHGTMCMNKKKNLRALAIFLNLLHEMPWINSAATEAYYIIECIEKLSGVQEELLDEKKFIKDLIDKNGWPVKDLEKQGIPFTQEELEIELAKIRA